MPLANRLAYRFYRALWVSLDWLYPPICGGCDKPGFRWCAECQETARKISPPLCSRCGIPLPTRKSGELFCRRCQTTSPSFEAARAWAAFGGPVQQALHRLKYQRDMGLGDALAVHLLDCFQNLHWPVELIIPVPLSIDRLAQRGYNQATLLARPLALGTGIPFCPQALAKVRETRSQVDLTVEERKQNVSGAFRATPHQVAGRHVLLVDDVMTSGATLDACASALLSAGACQVFCLTFARAIQS